MTVGTDTLVGDMPFRGRLAVLVGAGDRSAADLRTGLDQDGGAGPCCRSASSSRWPSGCGRSTRILRRGQAPGAQGCMLAFEACLEFGGATRWVHPDRPITCTAATTSSPR